MGKAVWNGLKLIHDGEWKGRKKGNQEVNPGAGKDRGYKTSETFRIVKVVNMPCAKGTGQLEKPGTLPDVSIFQS